MKEPRLVIIIRRRDILLISTLLALVISGILVAEVGHSVFTGVLLLLITASIYLVAIFLECQRRKKARGN